MGPVDRVWGSSYLRNTQVAFWENTTYISHVYQTGVSELCYSCSSNYLPEEMVINRNLEVELSLCICH